MGLSERLSVISSIILSHTAKPSVKIWSKRSFFLLLLLAVRHIGIATKMTTNKNCMFFACIENQFPSPARHAPTHRMENNPRLCAIRFSAFRIDVFQLSHSAYVTIPETRICSLGNDFLFRRACACAPLRLADERGRQKNNAKNQNDVR